MGFIEVLEQDRGKYNQFVAAPESGSFLQSWEWGEWHEALGRQVCRYWILDDNGERLGSVQLIKMPLPFGKFYLYAPYGPVAAGPDSRKSEVGSRVIEELIKKFNQAVFIRLEPKETFNFQLPTFNLPIYKSANTQPAKTLLVDLTKSEDQLLGKMHPKTRYNIKVAQKHGVEIKDEFDISIGHGLFFDEALKLIIATSRRQNFTTFPPSYYRKMSDFFALHNRGALKLHIYKAVYNNQLLAAAIMLDFGKTRVFLFGGSSSDNKNIMAPYLLHWRAMLDAKAQGLSTYDFWGIETSSGEVPGFVRFKLGFGGQARQYPGAFDVVSRRFLYRLYSSARLLNKLKRKISG